MAKKMKTKMLVNLPDGFFRTPELKSVFTRLGKNATLRKRSWNTPEEIEKDLAWAEAVLMWSWPVLDESLLAKAPHLRFAGHINLERAGAQAELAHGLAVSEARHGWSPAVSEMALALILNGLRRVSAYHMQMRQGKEAWVNDIPFDVDPLERQLTGRSVGIVGFGRIGQRLAELLAPFHCTIRAYDPYLPKTVAKGYGATLTELMPLMKQSEVIVLCAASTDETSHLVGARAIRAIPRNALLVNVGRAALVDMKALQARLRKRDLFAALDVFEQEPLAKNSPLRKLENAFLTPHRAGGLTESVVRIMNGLADDFEAFLKGRKRTYALSPAVMTSL